MLKNISLPLLCTIIPLLFVSSVVLRYKEYERERRLLERRKRRIEKGLEPGPLPTDTQAM